MEFDFDDFEDFLLNVKDHYDGNFVNEVAYDPILHNFINERICEVIDLIVCKIDDPSFKFEEIDFHYDDDFSDEFRKLYKLEVHCL